MIITSNEHIDQMAGFLGSGSNFGCSFSYRVQDEPKGIAEALGMAEQFIGNDNVCAILGDNVYFDDLTPQIQGFSGGAHVFLKEVSDPKRFGVVELSNGLPVSIEEKPDQPKSSYAQTGCYICDSTCFATIANLTPSSRNELEITDVTKSYMNDGKLTCTILQDEWIDAGTFESLYKATKEVRSRKEQVINKQTSALVEEQPMVGAPIPPLSPQDNISR